MRMQFHVWDSMPDDAIKCIIVRKAEVGKSSRISLVCHLGVDELSSVREIRCIV